VRGDTYVASKNLDVKDDTTQQPADGQVIGDPTQARSWFDYEENRGSDRARPAQCLTAPDQPAIQAHVTSLPEGQGWDNLTKQQQFKGEEVKEVPTLGDLELYKKKARQYTGTNPRGGSSLTYNVAKADGTLSSKRVTVRSVYAGADGAAKTADDLAPLVLIGTPERPIVIDGPVVIPGDVIIRGVITGRGTIYAGRNIHVVGTTVYKTPPVWPSIERDPATGKIRQTGVDSGPASNLGVVCTNGEYFPPHQGVPRGCI
jgi:hypothetical protein